MRLKENKELPKAQRDFSQNKSLFEEIGAMNGVLVDFYPKFHPEFNFIELY
jgi:hypothetical protein